MHGLASARLVGRIVSRNQNIQNLRLQKSRVSEQAGRKSSKAKPAFGNSCQTVSSKTVATSAWETASDVVLLRKTG